MSPTELARMEHIEQHLKFLKESDILRGQALTRIESALIGNPMTDNWGLVQDVKAIKKRVDILETDKLQFGVYFNQFKWVFGIVSATIIVALVGIFMQSLKNGVQLRHVEKIENHR